MLRDPSRSESAPRPAVGPSYRTAGRIGAILLTIVVLVWISVNARPEVQQAVEFIERMGPWAPVLFVILYVLATVLFVPGSALGLGAGALFGTGVGFLCVSVGSTIGATAAFLLSRHLIHDRLMTRWKSNPRLTALNEAVARDGWKIVALARLSPLFPFAVTNYAFGLTRVRFRDFLLASWLGMMPGTLLYVYLGSIARSGTPATERTPAEWAFYSAGLLATIGITVFLTRIARRAFSQGHEHP